MERYSNQSNQTSSPAAKTHPAAVATAHKGGGQNKSRNPFDSPTLASKIMVLSLILVSIAVTGTILAGVVKSFSNNDLAHDDQYQAVFLDNGQVYFGLLSDVNKDYIRLTDIFYLQVEQQIQPDQDPTDGSTPQPQQQISLAKLGNELHGPEDEMFINRDKIVFWENLKSSGQVVTAITDFKVNGSTTPADTGGGTTNTGTDTPALPADTEPDTSAP